MRILFFLVLHLMMTPIAFGVERPNLLWITAEDMSPTLGCYGDNFANTPHLDQFAKESVRYTQAFASAPVCSPARSCLITGCYAQSLGTHQMRSAFPIPDEMRGFPALLRAEGYYTTNNVKTDYNNANWQTIIKESWVESSDTAHWRNRKTKDSPFFTVFNLMTTHQSRTMVWPETQFVKEIQSQLKPNQIHDAAHTPLPSYYPETPLIRKTVARFYDCVTLMDQQVGKILKQLEGDGLAENTIVFFYSDHGSGMPRHKRALLDSGMHVPLMIRFPKKWADLAPAKRGETIDRLVSFVDFAPTVLSLAGIPIPKAMQGRAFLGEQSAPARDFVFGHRDRVDEVFDMARSVRNQRYLYIRNFMPHLGYNQPTAWPDQGAIRHEFYRLENDKSLTPAQRHFVSPTRPVEELYDCQADPQNIRNLAGLPEHAQLLNNLQTALRNQMRTTHDVGVLPESEAWKFAARQPLWNIARESGNKLKLEEITDAAFRVGLVKESELVIGLKHPNAAVRYWSVIGLRGLPKLSESATTALSARLDDKSQAVRIEAANAILHQGPHAVSLHYLNECLQHKDLTVVLHAARTVQLLGKQAERLIPAMEKVLKRAGEVRPADTPATVVQSGDQDLAMFISFAAQAFLENQKKGTRRETKDQKWIPLFDGKTLDGWRANVDAEITVKAGSINDGEIQLLSKGKNLWLVHNQQFDDFEMTAEVMVPKAGYNSGIGFRCKNQQGKPKGYQCEIENEKSGMIYAIGSGWVWPKGKAETERFQKMAGDCFKPGEWNRFRIRCEAEHIQIWVNDTKTADLNDERFQKGVIAIQHHGKGDLHRFRNLQIRELNTKKDDAPR